MSLRENGFFTPRLKPGEQKRPKTKGLQPLKGLNAKAENDRFSHFRQAKAWHNEVQEKKQCPTKKEW